MGTLMSRRRFLSLPPFVFVVALIFLSQLVACDWVPRKVSMSDARIQPLLTAASSFPRTNYGFTPLPQEADVRWEAKPRATYDAMLHIFSKTSRTIAFRRTAHGYRWIGEQEIFFGPKEYTTVDGTFHEQICLTYEIESVSGFPLNRLNVTYSGEDTRLAGRQSLTLADVRPILKQWGY